MRRALQLARRGWGQTAPNPLVGAVVVRDGEVIAEGYHARYGGPHAEAAALAKAGARARGADVYVTLEPCNHHGKTPPCAAALIAAGVRRVIVAVEDPNPIAGGGAAVLRAAGIEVITGVEAEKARELNAAFLFAHTQAARPFVTLKLALSREGALAPADRAQRWLSGEAAVREVHRLRASADAILVGIGTAMADDPALTVRHGRAPRVPPRRLVLDRGATLPRNSQLARTAQSIPVEVLAAQPDPERVAALKSVGVAVYEAPSLAAHLTGLRERGVRHLFVEGGAAVADAFLQGGFVDRWVIFQTPVPLGEGALRLATALPSAGGLAGWTVVSRRSFGPDRCTTYRPVSR